MRVRGRALAGAAVLALVLAVIAWVGWHEHRAGPSPSSPLRERGTWQPLPPPPVSPRADALAVWTGREALFLGGAARPCPPYISCDAQLTPSGAAKLYGLRYDGAAYDPATHAWRRLAPAPLALDAGTEAAYAGGHLLAVDVHGRTWDYDVANDRWSRFDARWDVRNGLSAAGGRVYGQTRYDRPGGHVVAYDPATSTWSRYPADRLRPRLNGFVVATTNGPALVGVYASRLAYHRLPSTAVVDGWSGQAWRRLPLTGQLDREYTWTGRRLVDPVQGTRYHGGPDAWPHRYPEGGALDLATGVWSPLPASWQAAEVRYGRPTPGWDVEVPHGVAGPWFVVNGSVYDDDTGSAWLLPRPAGAPAYFTSAVWADGRLVALGGASFRDQHETGVSGRAWIYTP